MAGKWEPVGPEQVRVESIHELNFAEVSIQLGIRVDGNEPWNVLEEHELRVLATILGASRDDLKEKAPGLYKLLQYIEGAIAFLERGGFPAPGAKA